ncbi:hypothetical protein LUZ60_007374 [Juncus effusus]|nr:hypothetical protein LUZ60_007374 [Juncus effusus]
MSLENADQSQLESPPENPAENPPELNKKPKITYEREFLLSFSELEICKKSPKGLDPSILRGLQCSELQETANNGPARYGSSTYSKAGRWETRSTGSSDKDAESQTERDSFAPERKYGQYKPRSWQPAGQDGLLGKPSGFVAGTSPSRTGTFQLSRTSEPYQPPRPYKAAPYGRKDVDSCNDETFGSTEISVTEEERKRRASFEMMRKEQHKVLQEKQSQKDKEKEIKEKEKEKMKSSGDDILSLIQGSNSNESAKIAIPQKDEGLDENLSSSLKSSSSLSRPLVPPGFAGGERKLQKESEVKSGGAREEKHITTEGFIINEKNKEIMMPQNIMTEGFIINENNKEISLPQNNNNNNNISILEKFFGSTLSKSSETSSSFVQIENELPKTEEELLIPQISSESASKFAHWFTEEDSKPVEDNQSEDLLSLFSKNTPKKEKTVSQFHHMSSIPMEENIIIDHIPPQTQTLNLIKTDPISNLLTPSNGPQNPNPNPNPGPPVLTCEDLEQLMLSQAGINDHNNNTNISTNNNIPRNPNPNIPTQNWQVGGPKSAADVDNSASHHLLSLLTKEKTSEIPPSTNLNANPNNNINININNPNPSDGSVTLEAIFGAAFMNELHSMDAPVSSLQENNNNINNNNSLLFPNLVKNKKREMETINLPEEESLFSVNDPALSLQPNPNSSLLPFQNPSSTKSQGLGLGPFNTNIPVSHLPPETNLPNMPLSNFNDPNVIMNQRMRQFNRHQPSSQFDFDQGRHVIMQQQQSARGFGNDVDPVRHGLNRSGVSRPVPVPHGPGPQAVHQVQVRHHLPHEMVGLGLPRNFPMHQVQHQQQQQPNFGVGMPGAGNQMQREELERIMQMEMRAKAAQQAGRIPPGGYFGPELDMDFRYR